MCGQGGVNRTRGKGGGGGTEHFLAQGRKSRFTARCPNTPPSKRSTGGKPKGSRGKRKTSTGGQGRTKEREKKKSPGLAGVNFNSESKGER